MNDQDGQKFMGEESSALVLDQQLFEEFMAIFNKFDEGLEEEHDVIRSVN